MSNYAYRTKQTYCDWVLRYIKLDEVEKVNFPFFRSFPDLIGGSSPAQAGFNRFWMPPYQVRGRLIRSGMTKETLKIIRLTPKTSKCHAAAILHYH
jgi:hypothetical protein